MYNKFTNQEAIASYQERLKRTDAMAKVINIAQYTVEKEKTANG